MSVRGRHMGTACGGTKLRPGDKSVPAARHARTVGRGEGEGHGDPCCAGRSRPVQRRSSPTCCGGIRDNHPNNNRHRTGMGRLGGVTMPRPQALIRRGVPCPCCWPESRGRGVRRTGHKVAGYYREPLPVRRTPSRYGGNGETGTGAEQVVAQVVNGLPILKRPAGTNSWARFGTATPVCDRQGDPCPCCWPESRGRGVRRTPSRYGGNGEMGTGTGQVVAQVVNGLPTLKRPAGTNSWARFGTATPVCDRQGGLCPCRWPKSRGRGVRRTLRAK
jgi:hypothetical protein